LDIIPIEVWDSPVADFYYNPMPAIQSELTEFIDISNGNPSDWEWYIEGQYISNEERPTYVFDEQGEYLVTEIIIDETPSITLNELLSSYELWYVDINQTSGFGETPFL